MQQKILIVNSALLASQFFIYIAWRARFKSRAWFKMAGRAYILLAGLVQAHILGYLLFGRALWPYPLDGVWSIIFLLCLSWLFTATALFPIFATSITATR